jgi:hypothetical protein
MARGRVALECCSRKGLSAALPLSAGIALLLLLAFATGNVLAQDFAQLGPAPWREEPQDVTALPAVPQDAAALPAVPQAAKTRDQAVQLYYNLYVPGNAVSIMWTGSVAGCDPGTTNFEHQQAVIDRINYYRAMVDLPPVTLVEGTPVLQEEAAALIFSANNALSHTPPTSWACYSAAGATGASQSNIALGASGVRAIDLYVDDPGVTNTAVGHRRWVLFPPRTGMSTGDVPSTGSNGAANALFVFGPSGTRPATPNAIAWPPAGFIPYQRLPSASKRWSFSYPGADFSRASVTVTGPGGTSVATLEPVQNGYGDNTLVFLPSGISYTKPAGDSSYLVSIQGIGGTAPASVEYTVIVIDPAVGTGDSDGDGVPDNVEVAEGMNPFVKDNDVFTNARRFAMQQYRDFLGREAEPAGASYWSNVVATGAQTRAQVIVAFFNSPEFQACTTPVVGLYFASFLRIPDYGGVLYWGAQCRSGRPLADIAQAFAMSPEFMSKYGTLTNAQFVALLYQNVLGRPADAGGQSYWTGQLDHGTMSRGDALLGFSESSEFKLDIDVSVFVTMMYIGMLHRSPEQGGFNAWVDYLEGGRSGLDLIQGILGSMEYHQRFLP